MPKIVELYAFVSTDASDEDEGVIAALSPDTGIWMPLVGADMARATSMKEIARKSATATGKVVKLLRFSVREELEVFEP